MLVLKPMKEALQAGDPIRGVIKGSGINQDGKTNGITAPGGPSQTELQCQVYDRFGIHPDSIGYIETHGTGTKLGDPIEINALSETFAKYGTRKRECPIGSLKTNIGHTLAFAGLAGLMKLLLCLEHKTLVPSLNYANANNRIGFGEKPFYLNTKPVPWETSLGTLRRGAVNSFGISGTNAHVVLEEAPAPPAPTEAPGPSCYLIPLSAKTTGALDRKITDLLRFVETNRVEIGDLAFTLTVGREHFPIRSVFLAADRGEILDLLTAVSGGEAADGYLGPVVEGKADISATMATNLGGKLVEELAQANNLAAENFRDKLKVLGSYYVQQGSFDLAILYEKGNHCRIGLPGYPFRGECYWLPRGVNQKQAQTATSPLTLVELESPKDGWQQFVASFTGQEFFLAEHIIAGQKLLPAVVCLEMACVASFRGNRDCPIRLTDVLWVKPIAVEEGPRDVSIRFYTDNGDTAFEVVTNDSDEEEIHVRGNLDFPGNPEISTPERLPIQAIIKRCPQVQDGQTFYAGLDRSGYHYGPAFKPLNRLFIGDQEVLARLKLAPELQTADQRFHLHPTLMDGLLQTAMGLLSDQLGTSWTPLMPLALGELVVTGPLPTCGYAHATRAPQSREDSLAKFNLVFADNSGRVCLQIRNYALKAGPARDGPLKTEAAGPHYFLPVTRLSTARKAEPVPAGPLLLFGKRGQLFSQLEQRFQDGVVLAEQGTGFKRDEDGVYHLQPLAPESYHQLLRELETRKLSPAMILHTWALDCPKGTGATLRSQIEQSAHGMIWLAQALQARATARPIRLVFTYSGEVSDHRPAHRAVSGLFKTLTREQPSLFCKTLEIQGTEIDLAEWVEQEFRDGGSAVITYKNGWRYRQTFQITVPEQTGFDKAPLRQKGTYLITGGAGGLGLHIAEHLVGKFQANLVLCGRSSLTEDQNARIKGMESKGAHVVYLQTDISDCEQVETVLVEVRKTFGPINGIIHAAGAIRDSFVMHKTREEMDEVLSAKVEGTLNLDRATAEEPLDFFVMFSSATAALGNPGQSDYAYANGFMDHYAIERTRLREQGSRRGKTLSINWSLWRDGGMNLKEAEERELTETFGMVPMDLQSGLTAFEQALVQPGCRLMIVAGDRRRIEKALAPIFPPPDTEVRPTAPDTSLSDLKDHAIRILKTLFAEEIKVPAHKIRDDEPLERYGIDSVLILSLNKVLEQHFGPLSKTLLFEYQTLGELAKYFAENHGKRILEKAEPSARKKTVQGAATPTQPTKQSSTNSAQSISQQPHQVREPKPPLPTDKEPIAIIGLDGRYPMAPDLDAYWANLKSGRDCIVEIPPERWPAESYFNPDKNQRGKIHCKWGGFLEKVDHFDPLFFKISPREAEFMDPQERLFLETAWRCIEDAGYTKKSLAALDVGVFAGVMYGQYQLFGLEESRNGEPISTDSSYASIANRVSYTFDFQGPSMAVDTMCSSSITAIHLACNSLRQGEIHMALAGGVNLSLHPYKYIQLSQGKFLASDGRCRSFGVGGDGYVPGEGVGAVLLKPLSKALADGDPIYALIKGSSVNHGGKTNGYTVPNPKAQAKLIDRALEHAGTDPATISYVEAHGTGTSLGDPIEITGLSRSFRSAGLAKQSCPIGSVKSNIGHLEAAAGIAALTKVLLQMRHGELVPSIHSERLNPNINFADSPFKVQKELAPWEVPHPEIPLRAGISSFGAGGSNGHLIVEAWDPQAGAHAKDSGSKICVHTPSVAAVPEIPQILVLSARDEDRLKAYATKLRNFLTDEQTPDSHPFENWCLQITTIAAEVIGTSGDEIDLGEDLGELGFDPLNLNKLVFEINQRFQFTIDSSVFSAQCSLESFCRYLWDKQQLENQFAASPIQPPKADLYLPDLAFTLQTGREPMPVRMAVVASNTESLLQKLDRFLEGGEEVEAVYKGNAKRNHLPPDLLVEDEESRIYLRLLIKGNKFHKLAQLWVSGVTLDWEQLHSPQPGMRHPRRISAPTYPFAGKRFWITETKRKLKDAPPPQQTGSTVTNKILYFNPVWEPAPLMSAPALKGARLLVFDNGTELGASLREHLALAGDADNQHIWVKAGAGFRNWENGEFQINPQQPTDYESLLRVLEAKDLVPTHVVQVWALNGDSSSEYALNHGVYSLFHLFRAIAKAAIASPRRLIVCHPEHSPHWQAVAGYSRSLTMLHPGLSLTTIQTDDLADGAAVLKELAAENSGSGNQLRYRNLTRYRKNLKQLDLQTKQEPLLRARGVYLITGGLGALGIAFSGYLAKQYGARLALAGRSPMNAEKREQLNRLKKKGGSAAYFSCDIADAGQVRSLVAAIKQRFGTINGIIHASGIFNPSTLPEKNFTEFKATLAAKIQGTLFLDEATRQEPLDFFLLFSSTSAVLGDFGQCDYAVGNRFQDAYVSYRSRIPSAQGRTMAINWPLWKSGGMHLDPSAEGLYMQSSGFAYLENEQGIRCFEAILASGLSQVGLLVGNPTRLKKLLQNLQESGQSQTRDLEAKPHGDLDSKEQVEGEIRQKVSEILKIEIDQLDGDQGFGEFGFDSISLLELAQRLSDHYGLEIAPTTLFSHGTIDGLRDWLWKEQLTKKTVALKAGRPKAVDPDIPAPIIDPQESNLKPNPSEPIAIIGMSGIFPQSRDLEAFWDHLLAGQNLVTEVPAERWNWRDCFGDPGKESNKTNSRWGGFIDDVDRFDPDFFYISEPEARLMDPQQRLFLQTAWKSIEDAGYRASQLSGSATGVFVGTQFNDYQTLLEGIDEPHAITGNQDTILPNRISYLLNFHGPSEPVNTACSSGLVAVHRAVRSLRSGECELAIAGAVSLMLTPANMIAASRLGMLARDGKCKTFDKDADGFVKGEGVAALILKPLKQALADGDPIHAVIRGSQQNHGGKTSSLTAPNPTAQAALLVGAYQEAGFDPETVSYIEMHGTGTALGDPVEVAGLERAFQDLAKLRGTSLKRKGFCGLGSVKTNIGHLEPAAGIAGLVKVILAMRHKKLPASLHLKTMNPHIKLENSPFFVVRSTRDWEPLADENGHPLPRRAGVSSFGFGGVNAHVAIEEYEARRSQAPPPVPQVIVLSAKNKQALNRVAANLLAFLNNRSPEEGMLARIAFTLQVGREPMESRLAFVASDIESCKTKLVHFLKGDSTEVYESGQPIGPVVGPAANDLEAQARQWVQGKMIDWRRYHSHPPARMSLPTYPFARKRYWVPASQRKEAAQPQVEATPGLSHHPMLARYSWSLSGIAFNTGMTCHDYYLSGHQIFGNCMLPGVAYLELARAAGEEASGLPVREIHDALWLHPMVVQDSSDQVRLLLDRQDQVRYRLLSGGNGRAETCHGEGTLVFESDEKADIIDLDAIRKRCPQVRDGALCYQNIATLGMVYGSQFRGLKSLRFNENEALAQLVVPDGARPAGLWIEPALMDAALQGASALMNDREAHLPISLGAAVIHEPLPDRCYAHITRGGRPTRALVRFHIRVVNEQGQTLVLLRDLAFQPQSRNQLLGQSSHQGKGSAKLTVPATVSGNEVFYFHPVWVQRDLPFAQGNPLSGPVLAVGWNGRSLNELEKQFPQAALIPWQPGQGELPQGQLDTVLYYCDGRDMTASIMVLPKLCKALFERGETPQIACIGPALPLAAMDGFCRVLSREQETFQFKLIQWDSADLGPLFQRLSAELAVNHALQIQFRDGQRFERQFRPMDLTTPTKPDPFRPGGVYMITGGAGGLGMIMARYLARTAKAKLVLVGRSAPDTAIQKKTAMIEEDGGQVLYQQADVCDLPAMRAVVQRCRREFGALHGVIHGAGLSRDRLFRNKNMSDFRAVAAPKVTGTLTLDLATAEEPLDFFIMFSSAASVLGNIGQSDYAAANSFMDGFATHREGFCRAGKRHGKSLSINWPLWRDGGMSMEVETMAQVFGKTGMRFLEIDEGLRALRASLSSTQTQIFPVVGDKDKIEAIFRPEKSEVREVPTAPDPMDHELCLTHPVSTWVRGIVAEVLQVASDRIQDSRPFPDYGIDSFLNLKIVRRLEQQLGTLPNTLLFEYSSLEELVPWLLEHHGNALAKRFPAETDPGPASESEPGNTAFASDENGMLALQTKQWITRMVAEVLQVETGRIDGSRPFPDYGIDSFLNLKIVRKMEQQLGTLSNTLLFEYSSVDELVPMLLEQHETPLRELFKGSSPPGSNRCEAPPFEAAKPKTAPLVIRESHLQRQSESLRETIGRLLEKHGAEASALARNDIAPFLFLGSKRTGFFYFNQKESLLFAFSYVGPGDDLAHLASELADYCSKRNLKLNLLQKTPLTKAGAFEFTATPFGVRQYLPDISNFSLAGTRMRRLRYQISKFEKAGQGRTVEYRPGKDPETDGAISRLIDAWCARKTMVNPYIRKVKRKLAAGELAPIHRLFLTYLDGRLQNGIVITKMVSENGYLMDLEFYPADMPLGGLEFSIFQIIQQLREEGCTCFSMGATFGSCTVESPNGDPERVADLARLRSQAIFDGSGNFQFKNKFRPVTEPLYLCAVKGQGGPVLDVIMLLASPANMEDDAPLTRVQERRELLAKSGYNPANIDPKHIDFELMTDSWRQLQTDFVKQRMADLKEASRPVADIDTVLKKIFPFRHVITATSGREAEMLLCKALPAMVGKVPQNLLFPTWITQQIQQDLSPVEVPVSQVFDLNSSELFKGNLDLESLKDLLEKGGVSFVCVEVGNNASGGYPISMANLKQVRFLANRHEVPVVMDATRLLENAFAIADHELQDKDLWEIAADILSQADHVTASLCKDFSTPVGGIVATNDSTLAQSLQRAQKDLALSSEDIRSITLALSDRDFHVRQVRQRMTSVRLLWEALHKNHIPIAKPAGGHCVLVDVAQIPEFAARDFPLASFLAWLYERTGIRAGLHSAGMQKETALNGLVRLAIPAGMPPGRIEDMILLVLDAFQQKKEFPQLERIRRGPGLFGEAQTLYREKSTGRSGAKPPEHLDEFSGNEPLCNQDRQPLTIEAVTQRKPAEGPGFIKTKEAYSLSEGQKSLWILHQMNPANVAYNLPNAFRIRFPVNPALLKQAFNILLARHPILTQVFLLKEDQPIQAVRPQCKMELGARDLSHLDWKDCLQTIEKRAFEPFILERNVLIRADLYRTTETEHVLLIVFHHLILDGISFQRICAELTDLYWALSNGTSPKPPLASEPYSNFVTWQRDMLASEEDARHFKYWQKQLAGQLPVLSLQTDFPRPVVQDFEGAFHILPLDKVLMDQLREIAKAQKSSLFVILLSAFKLLLYRHTHDQELVVGTPTEGRPQSRFEATIGYFVNMLPLRSRFSASSSFKSFSGQIRAILMEALDHRDFPFLSMVQRCVAQRDTNRTPVFQTLFSVHNWIQSQPGDRGNSANGANPDLLTDRIVEIQQKGEFDLSLEVFHNSEGSVALIKYLPKIFRHSRMVFLGDHFVTLLKNIALDPDAPIGEIPIISSAERRRNLDHWHPSPTSYPEDHRMQTLVKDHNASLSDGMSFRGDGRTPSARDSGAPTHPWDSPFEAPIGETEKAVASIWQDELGCSQVGRHDHFFRLGGHSLLAVKVLKRMNRQMNVNLPIGTLFRNPTPAAWSEEIEIQDNHRSPNFQGIPKVPRDGTVRLSFAQRRLWFLHRNGTPGSLYNVPLALRLHGPLDGAACREACCGLLARHEILRTRFTERSGLPEQIIERDPEPPFTLVDLSGIKTSRAKSDAQKLLSDGANRPFSMAAEIPFRGHLFRIHDQDHLLLFNTHHMASDMGSFRILLREFCFFYKDFLGKKAESLPELPFQYADFAQWQQRQLDGPTLHTRVSHWKQQLQGASRVLNLPLDFPRPPINSFEGAGHFVQVPDPVAARVLSLSRDLGVTPFMMLFAAYGSLLSRYSGQDDFCIGIPVAGRNQAGTENLIGLFVNTLVLPFWNNEPESQFHELLQRVRNTTQQALEHQDLPFEKLVEELQPERDMSRAPLFQAFFSFDNAEDQPLPTTLPHVKGHYQEFEFRTSKFDLSLYVTQTESSFRLGFEYNTQLFAPATIQRLAGHYLNLLSALTADPSLKVAQAPMMSESERRDQLEVWNRTAAGYPLAKTVYDLFKKQADDQPHRLACLCEHRQWTYGFLLQQVNQLAQRLLAEGTSAETPVAVLMDRSLDLITVMLAVSKAGATAIPMDPGFPSERLAYMLADSRAKLLITDRPPAPWITDTKIPVLRPAGQGCPVSGQNLITDRPQVPIHPEQLAYTIYTSGSSGNPKGVQIPHANLVNFLTSMALRPGCGNQDRLLAVTTICFDIAWLELFLPLVTGATLELCSAEVARDGYALKDRIEMGRATIVQATPSTWTMLLAAGWSKGPKIKIFCGGEALDRGLARNLLQRGDEVWNMFGPTETTIWSMVHPVQFSSTQIPATCPSVSLGSPVANTDVAILDCHLNPVPLGVAGELHIGGEGLARGYASRPALTAEKFVPHPYSKEKGRRIYKTGDLVRYGARADQEIPVMDFLGRIDAQVKLRGFRIEPGEIEACLRRHDRVKEAAVVLRTIPKQGSQLVAYMVSAGATEPKKHDLLSLLEQHLPPYMIPTYFQTLDRLPMTANGKLDRQALPTPGTSVSKVDFVAARTQIERSLADIWTQVLGLKKPPGVKDNFFDLGGHSLLLTQVLYKMEQTLGLKPQMVEMFQYPTIDALSRFLDSDHNAEAKPEPTSQLKPRKPQDGHCDIAVVGFSGRFPGAANVQAFWRNLRSGTESIRFLTDEELAAAKVAPQRREDPAYVKAGGFLDDIDRFDAEFFKVSPKEAETLDPQHRLFLEHAWQALEHAGYQPETPGLAIGVFAGAGVNGYLFSNLLPNRNLMKSMDEFQWMIQNDAGFLATRTSYKLNLKGPSINVQTACSTSLVAVHMACRSLMAGESDLTLAGGVSIMTPQPSGYLYREGMILSPDGHCRAFDASAQGTVPGCGLGIVVLKRLPEALTDGDTIHAVIKGTAVNNDGSEKVGYTAPSIQGQEAVIREALATARVAPETIGYLETHGTGTILGDPIEIKALTNIFGAEKKGKPRHPHRFRQNQRRTFGHGRRGGRVD